jgi:hypothetical protein
LLGHVVFGISPKRTIRYLRNATEIGVRVENQASGARPQRELFYETPQEV